MGMKLFQNLKNVGLFVCDIPKHVTAVWIWNQEEVDLEFSWIEKDNQGSLVDITEDKNNLMERMAT